MLWPGIGAPLMLEEGQLHMEMELTVHLPKTVLRGRLSLGSYSPISLLLSHMAVPNK